MTGWGAAGAGLSLLENATFFKEQPEEIKHINTVLGAATGAVMSHPDHKIKALAALSWPVKQMALMATGKAEQFRHDQAGLLDKKMQAAEIDLSAAEARRRAAGGNRAMAYAFLIPALLGGGGLAYYAWNKRKREQMSRFKTLDEHGEPQGRQRVKIEVPASAMPNGFFESLLNVDDNPKSRVRLQELQPIKKAGAYNPEDLQGYQDMWKKHWDRPGLNLLPEPQAPPSLPGQIAGFAGEFTGVPQLFRGTKELALSSDAMGEGRHSDVGRYGLAAIGNLGMGISGMNLLTAPLMGKILGRERVRDWLTNHSKMGLLERQTTTMPRLGRWIYRRAWGNTMDPTVKSRGGASLSQSEFRKGKKMDGRGAYDRARDTRYRYDPDRFAWDRAAVEKKYEMLNTARSTARTLPSGASVVGTALKAPESGTLFNRLLTKGNQPTSFWGQGLEAARFGANRGVNAAYRTAMLARRNPNMSLLLASLPLAGLGLERDKQRREGVDNILRNALPDYANRTGYGGTPISGTLSNLLGMVGANPAPSIQSQL